MPVDRTYQRVLWAIALLALITSAAAGYWIARGVPKRLPDAPSARLDCISYAPYRLAGESPFDPAARVSEQRVLEDLRVLSARSSCVRTYSVQQGLDVVPRIARQLGLKVLLGAWIGRDRLENDVELGRAIGLASEFRDVVAALIVGNEVLLRRELPESALRAYIEKARQAVAVPVTYADVWEFWLEHLSLASSVSFVTIHNLPYWEDEPVGVDQAVVQVLETVRRVKSQIPDKEILIGETGWPSAGRSRRAAIPGRIEQAQFVREFARAAHDAGQSYNMIEGFDQPWKRRLEGAMGGAWGLYDSHGRSKFASQGPIEADPGWQTGLVAMACGSVAFAIVAALLRRRAQGIFVHALAGAASGAVAAAQWSYMVVWNRDIIEWSVTGAFGLLAILLGWFTADTLALRAVRMPAARASTAGSSAPSIIASGGGAAVHRARLAALRCVFLFGGAVMTVLLIFDARYRGFPMPLYMLPAAAGVLLAVAGEKIASAVAHEHRLSMVIGLGSVLVIALERPSNVEALWFEALLLVIAGCATRFRYGLGGTGWRPSAASNASSTATAEGSLE
jgi:exo-beta-1,3-glucanase (GH17 family)